MINTDKIISIISAKVISYSNNSLVKNLLLDSRKIAFPETSMFFAIKGQRHDGHKFLIEAYNKGVRQFIVEEGASFSKETLPDSNILEVSSSIDALQKIARFHRTQFHIPIIGIAGSNGKTIIKEWLSQLLNKDFFIIKNPKSYNSQVGVPLSVWEINEMHTLGIFEAGISQPGEMANLEQVLHPNIGIFSNIGPAHDEGFANRQEKIVEKLKLFKNSEILIFCSDHKIIEETLKSELPLLSTFTWSVNDNSSDLYIKKLEKGFDATRLQVIYRGNTITLLSPFTDDASIENSIHCICALLYFKVSFEEIQNRLSLLHPVAMRLELKEGLSGCYIIDDTYNNDFAGLSIALDFLSSQSKAGKRTLILSDILETGQLEKELYNNVAKLIKSKNIDKFIGIGPKINQHKGLFHNGIFFTSTNQFLNDNVVETFSQETILVKGARVFQFEKIVMRLQKKIHGTVLHVNLDALVNNLNYYKSQLRPTTKVMVMVKAYAYGSGSYEVANLLQYHRVDYLGVAYVDEGVNLRNNGISLPIMVMNSSAEGFVKLKEYNLEPEIFSFSILSLYLTFLQTNKLKGRIHIKIDTGMRRLGFEEKEVDELITFLKNPALEVVSIFTHIAGSEDSTLNDFTHHQVEIFDRVVQKIEAVLNVKVIKHCLNSAGILRFPEYQMDMVRLGIGLYGVDSSKNHQGKLLEVGTLKSVVSQIKRVKAGETVGYNRHGKVSRDSSIATIAIGYADGFNRKLGNGKGSVWLQGRRCPTVGNVCMDMTMVDITGIEAKEGEEVTIFGKELSVMELAAILETIPYEILTSISERVKRVFYME